MTEQEIFESLCNHLMVINVENLLDNPFFKHCYDICMKNKNKMTDASAGEIVNREKEILF